MFTGLIHHFGKITSAERTGDLHITIEANLPGDVKRGDSIAPRVLSTDTM